MRKELAGILLAGCFMGMAFGLAGCGKGNSGDGPSDKQTEAGLPNLGEKSREGTADKDSGKDSGTVTAGYDENLQAILGDGLIYEILEDEDVPAMTVATYNDVALEEITVPGTVVYEEKEYQVTEIAVSAFESNALLQKITLPEGMKTINDSAFYSCPELKEVIFPGTVETIGESCFAECPNLSEIRLPDSLEYLGMEAFCNCISLKTITIPAKTAVIDNAVFYGCEMLEECSFQEGVTQIGNEMFTNCYGLCKVVIPDSVTTIGDEAFWSCMALADMELPDNVTAIGDRAFYSTGIKNLRLPENLSGVRMELLDGMDELEEIVVPKAKKAKYEEVFGKYGIGISTY